MIVEDTETDPIFKDVFIPMLTLGVIAIIAVALVRILIDDLFAFVGALVREVFFPFSGAAHRRRWRPGRRVPPM